MFDVRPVDKTGDLDWKKIRKIEKVARIEKPHIQKEPRYSAPADLWPHDFVGSEGYNPASDIRAETKIPTFPKIEQSFTASRRLPKPFFSFAKNVSSFAAVAFATALLIGVPAYVAKNFNIKSSILGSGQEGFANLAQAIENVKGQNFDASSVDFENAYENFSEASKDLDKIGSLLIDTAKYFPYLSQLSSGKNATEAGKHIALAGKSLNEVIKIAYSLKNSLNEKGSEPVSFLDIFRSTEGNLTTAKEEMEKAQGCIDEIKVDDLPADKQKDFVVLKDGLPVITKAISEFLGNEHIFVDLLGGNGPRKYLFLFQNNQEMRATGGFIGSYALLDISNGRIRKFFIDEIFNPDGQLKEKIVPPAPIQKMSAAWSLHDSNWFPDFPTSAEKAISFYEKAGGPTADGVITLTPTVMEKLLEITGPIDMPDYGVTLSADNFIAETQYKVEVDYSKEENRPKKILADLAPLVLDRIFNAHDFQNISRAIQVLSGQLREKQILLYSRNYDLQKIISAQGWSGEILNSSKDYLSVINTNINGYKTDGVIDENIEHVAEIQSDGSIIDTATITRKHNGGNSQYEWWNKVNADYMRLYVPEGSKLLEVSGQTREFDEPPLDYNALGFRRDPQVQMEEENMAIDEQSGTRIYGDAGKTVFANWVYVSPQETVTVKYKYILPFKISLNDKNNPSDSYSLLAQKQSGSIGSQFSSKIVYPDNYNVIWKYPDEISSGDNNLEYKTDLKTDKFVGVTFLSR